MKRLIKKSMMDMDVLKGTIEQLGDSGREILKDIEEFKFKLEQAARIVSFDQMLSQKILQKQKALDGASSQIYGAVFDLENLDITKIYEQQQMMMNNPSIGIDGPNGEQIPNNYTVPNGAPIPQGGPASAGDNGEDDAGGGFSGGGSDPAGEFSESDEGEEKEQGEGNEEGDEEDLEEDLPEEPEE